MSDIKFILTTDVTPETLLDLKQFFDKMIADPKWSESTREELIADRNRTIAKLEKKIK